MTSGFLSTWAVARDVQAGPADRGPHGLVLEAALDAWIGACVDEYIAMCPTLAGAALRRHWTRPDARRLGRAAGFALSATVSEVLPSALLMRVRVRPLEGDVDAPADIPCRLELIGPDGAAAPVSAGLRDEVIAVERAARIYN